MRVLRLAVGREALDRGVGEAGGDGLALHQLRGRGETGRALDAVEPAELADRLERGDAVDLGVDRRGNGVGPEGDRAVLGEGGAAARRTRR